MINVYITGITRIEKCTSYATPTQLSRPKLALVFDPCADKCIRPYELTADIAYIMIDIYFTI